MQRDKLEKQLVKYGQEHLLAYLDRLDPEKQISLVKQIQSVDLKAIRSLSASLLKPESPEINPAEVEPLHADKAYGLADGFSRAKQEEYSRLGWEALRAGKVAAFLVAGGQGSRLGHEGPKGTFDPGLPTGKTLFQLIADQLRRISCIAEKSIPWYVMTSPANHRATLDYFRANGNLGYPSNEVFFFPQGQMPAVDEGGKLLMEKPDGLALSPNGNGGCFQALKDSGALNDMKKKGVTHVFFFPVDNPLVKIVDPLFVGYTLHRGDPIGSKVVAKRGPDEKVGVLLNYQGKPRVIEYSDLPPALRDKRTQNGNLQYGLGNIAVHLFQWEFLKAQADEDLPYHKAHKKIPYVDPKGNQILPEAPNGYKFERFMFDVFPRAKSMAALIVPRESEFAPIKNKDGEDSPATARDLLLRQWEQEPSFPRP